MIVIVASASVLIISILLFFIESIIIKILILAVSLFILVFSIYSLLKKIRINEMILEEKTVNQHEPLNIDIRDKDKLESVERQNKILLEELEKERGEKQSIIEEVAYLCSALPVMKELAYLVIDKTEESAISLTENIFQISNKSSQVGNHIKRFLQEMFSGETSLKNNIDILSGEMKSINKLIDDFSSIKSRYIVDMKKINENVQVINSFLAGIRDVSDRTGLLAINSSIEAARVGSAGKGFSVLAGEIQGLASTSKEISIQIDEIVEVISETVKDSFDTLELEITTTLDELNNTHKDLSKISTDLNMKVSDVETYVKDSNTLSKTVTEQLNNVSVNMQYQDITRQILEHIMSTLSFYRTKLEEKEPEIIAHSDKKEKRDDIVRKSSSFFTIEDEWRLFGLETVVSNNSSTNDSEEFKGNVEMF